LLVVKNASLIVRTIREGVKTLFRVHFSFGGAGGGIPPDRYSNNIHIIFFLKLDLFLLSPQKGWEEGGGAKRCVRDNVSYKVEYFLRHPVGKYLIQMMTIVCIFSQKYIYIYFCFSSHLHIFFCKLFLKNLPFTYI